MKAQCNLSAHSNGTCFSCWISHVPTKMRRWWICLPSRAICIVHYTARLDPCAWIGMGNWTRPGASSMQLLSLGRRSSTESGLKSAWDTWHYQLRINVNWEIWSPEAIGTHKHVRGCLTHVCLFVSEKEGLTNHKAWVCVWDCEVQCVCLCVCQVWGGAGPSSRGFVWTTGLWRWPWTLPGGLVAVDYRARCPSVLNKRMSRIKRQCSPVCCKLGFTAHFRDRQEAQEPPDMMDKSIDSAASVGHLDLRWDSALMQHPISLQQRVMMIWLSLQTRTEEISPCENVHLCCC